jgi:hypothetical protein
MNDNISKTNTHIKDFINNVINKQYKNAHSKLSHAVDQKIKQQIINNNINLF